MDSKTDPACPQESCDPQGTGTENDQSGGLEEKSHADEEFLQEGKNTDTSFGHSLTKTSAREEVQGRSPEASLDTQTSYYPKVLVFCELPHLNRHFHPLQT
ncbi:hypothetical protein STEG23_037070 [Scotinomys teguina]